MQTEDAALAGAATLAAYQAVVAGDVKSAVEILCLGGVGKALIPQGHTIGQIATSAAGSVKTTILRAFRL